VKPLSQTEAGRIARMIAPDLRSYSSRYDKKKYWPAVYKKVCIAFGSPRRLHPDVLRDALLWKYGHLGKTKYPKSHSRLIRDLQRIWPRFAKRGIVEPAEILKFLKQESGRSKAFITFAFLIHLLNQTTLPIIDQHNYRSVNHYIRSVRRSWTVKRPPRNLDDLYAVRDFIAAVRGNWPPGEPRPRRRTLDKFLMMHGKALKGRGTSRATA